MKTSLSSGSLQSITGRLTNSLAGFSDRYPGESGKRQPVHTVYGGAHLFKSDTAVRLGSLAVRSFDEYAPDPSAFAEILGLPAALADTIHQRVREKLGREAVEDFRIDFEDGYGTRADDEEDGHAVSAAQELAGGHAAGTLSPFIGIRIKTFSEELHNRSIRTLDLFLTALIESTGGKLPENFVVTLPKIVGPAQVGALADIFDEIEPKLGLPAGSLKMEMMIETTQSIISEAGEIGLPKLLDAFRTGAGVPYADYGADLAEGQAGTTRPQFRHQLAQEWIPALPDVHARLRQIMEPEARRGFPPTAGGGCCSC